MRRKIRTFIVFSAVALFGAALPSPGAETPTARVVVPFSFTAGTVTLPAGDYVVMQTDRVVTITGKGGEAMVMVGPADWTPGSTTCALTFQKTSRGNMLKEVQTYRSTSDLVKDRSTILK